MKRTLIYPIPLLLLALIGLLFVSTASAQRRGHDHERGRRGDHVRLLRGLDLTDAQKVEIRKTMQDLHAERQSWHEAHPNPSPEEQRAFFQEQHEAMREALTAVLTPEQLAKLEEMQDRGPRHRRRPGRNLANDLDLNEEQRTALRSLHQEQRAAMRAWMSDHPNASKEERRAYVRDQREALQEALADLLTPEQLTKLEALREERVRHRRDRRGRMDEEGTSDSPEPDGDAENQRFSLGNYPNPFNPTTEIKFELAAAAPVTLVVYDAQGREVRRLVEGSLSAGPHSVTFDASGLPSGLFVYRLTVGSDAATGRMTLAK